MTSAQDGGERPGSGRGGLVSALLADALRSLGVADRPLQVLDCGGGSGAFAVPLASPRCEVTVLDISADALATLGRRAAEAGVAAYVHPLNGDVEVLGSLVPTASTDVVLAHGILGAVDHVDATLAQMVGVLRPGGLLSLLIGNPDSAVLARALGGEPVQALAELRSLDRSPALRPHEIERRCLEHGLVPHETGHRHGIGVFSDLVPGAALDSPGARDAVRALDAEAASRAPFADIAGRIHLLFRRPAQSNASGRGASGGA